MLKDPTRGPSASISAQTPEDEIDLMELVRTLWRAKWLIMACAVLGFLIGVWYGFFQATPLYTARATVALESRESQVTDLTSVVAGLGGDQSTINTEVEVIRSRGLAKKLVDELDLVKDPEFNAALRKPEKYTPGAIVRNVVRLIRGEREAALPSETVQRDRTIAAVQSAITVSNLRQSYVFELTAVTQNAEKSALLANALAEAYIQDQLDVKFAATERATEWLSERVLELQTELETSESRLKEFSSNTDLISPEGLVGLNRWTAPIEWSGVNVSAWSASGLSARCFRVLAGDTQGSYAV